MATMATKLDGKHVIVTNAGSDVGIAVVERCIREGATVAAYDVDPLFSCRVSPLRDRLAHELHPRSVKAQRTFKQITFRVGEYNASEMEDVTSLYQTLEKTSKSHFDANVIVNCNSESTFCGSASMLNHESFMEGIKSKVHPVFNLSNIYINHWRQRLTCPMTSRVIINLASVTSTLKASKQKFVYSAAMGAVIAMTKSIAMDYAGLGIRSNVICPTDSPTATHVDDIASMVVYLASDQSSSITGSVMVVDNGFSN